MRTPLLFLIVLILLATFINSSNAQDPTDALPTETPVSVSTPSVAADNDSPIPVPVRSDFNPALILSDFSIGHLVLLVIGVVLGGIGGFGAELMGSSEQDVELPGTRNPENRIDIGFWARVILGAISAIIALYLIGPQDLITYIAVSLLGGLFGTATLKLIEGRFMAALAGERARNDQLRHTLSTSQQETEELLGLFQRGQPFAAAAAEVKTSEMAAVQEGLVRLDAILKNELRKDEGDSHPGQPK